MAEEGTTVLTGDAQAAARGELHGDIHANTAARDAALAAVPVESTAPADPEADTIDTPEAAA